MGFCSLGLGILPSGVRVGEAPYGILPPGIGLERFPMGDSLWDFAPWGGVGKAPYGILPPGVGLERLPMGFCPLG